MSSNPSSTTTARTAHESTAGRGRAGQAAALTAGPALLLVGMVLMLSPHLWLPSHLVFLAGTVGMLPTGVALHALVSDRRPVWLPRAALLLTVLGALALAGQFVIDLVVSRLAGGDDRAVESMFDIIQGAAALELVFYSAGPALLFTGLAGFGAALILRAGPLRRAGWLLVAGAASMGVARVVQWRAAEVVALAVILIGLAVVARSAGAGSIRLQAGAGTTRLPAGAGTTRLQAGAGTTRPPAGDAQPVSPPRRRAVLLPGVLGAAALAAGGVSVATGLPVLATAHDQVRLPIEQQRLRMEVSSGDVVLRRGTGTELLVDRTTRRGIVEPRVAETSGPDGISIEAECSGALSAGCGVSYDISVPDGFHLDIQIEAGSLTARDLAVDALHARIANGDVDLIGVTGGEAVVDVAAGDLALDFAEPPESVLATVSSGHIEIGVPEGSYDVRTETGVGDERIEVGVDPASGRTISAQTSHGDIEIVSNGR